jgi:hypothetical protein
MDSVTCNHFAEVDACTYSFLGDFPREIVLAGLLQVGRQ